MIDWKGKQVAITIWFDWTVPVATVTTWLDTDTMSDLFSQYDPSLYTFEVNPYLEDEDD